MYIIDRFEGDWVVIEAGGKTFNLPRELVPPEAAEGDVIMIKINIDSGATAKIKREVR
ncbi:MAG: DUF3006 domain-containing protein, partial [Desulfotomaculaceae bacterium]|nr:DUF3006 domain-containing protein [Desulfotomaculaceae bacterium]